MTSPSSTIEHAFDILGRMSVTVQESLLDAGDEPALGRLDDGSVRRTVLTRGAWVDLRRDWLAGSGALFARLAAQPGPGDGPGPGEGPGPGSGEGPERGIVPWRAEKRQMYDRVDRKSVV